MLALTPAEVHLWLICCREITDGPLLERYRQLLSHDEQEQERRFHHVADRHRHLLSRTLLRTALSQYSSVSPTQWTFTRDGFGRPRISNQQAGATELSFNLSHTREIVLLGITHRSKLGVDVESLHEPVDALRLADRYFSASEAASLRALPPDRQKSRFFDYWTLKESYVKALGGGLGTGLHHFSLDIQGSSVALAAEPRVNRNPDRWRFWLLRPHADHVAAVCVQRQGVNQSLAMRKVVPLVGQEPLEYIELAKSG